GGIQTTGDMASGILAQSVGGGGGNGGFAIQGSFAKGDDSTANTNSVGGSGGNGGTGGTVQVFNHGAISVSGAMADGIIAESVGGGGGNGGFAVSAALSNSKATTNSVGGSGGKGGLAQEVDVTNDAAI